jgi:PAS domain S-box-containing protein
MTVAYSDLIELKDKPVVAIDELGVVTYVNEAFENEYGWSGTELIGEVITTIMPPFMKDAHNFGFSRFLATEVPRILDKSLSLPIYCKGGEIMSAEHYIVGEKSGGKWRFAATITPSPKED